MQRQRLPSAPAPEKARVVALSSRGHQRSSVDFDAPHYEHRAYVPMEAYGQSKTANILFAVGLDRRGEPHGVRAFAVHPVPSIRRRLNGCGS